MRNFLSGVSRKKPAESDPRGWLSAKSREMVVGLRGEGEEKARRPHMG